MESKHEKQKDMRELKRNAATEGTQKHLME